SRDRGIRAHAVEAFGGGEHVGRLGGGRESLRAALAGRCEKDQCRKCRTPVNTIATPRSSAALITSLSRIDPPGWITAVAPASIAASRPSANGKKASDATTDPRVSGSCKPASLAASSALRAAMRAASTRLIWPAPIPTVALSLA